MKMPYWQDGPRLAQFANVRQYAEFAFLAAVSASAMGLCSRRFVVPSFLLASGAVFAIILTGSRGALLSWMLFMVLACCFTQARLRAALHAVLVLALSAGVVLYLDRSGTLPSPNIFGRIAEQQAGTASFDASRLRIWGQAFDQILARPLFGSGPEGYWLSNCCDRRVLQAHNFVLQFLMEFGVIGCALFVLLGAKAVQALGGVASTARAVMATTANRVLGCLLAAFFGFSLIDQMMYHLLPLLHLAVFAGLFAAGLVQARDRDMNLPPRR
jgi:O-antigen ligase